MHTGFLKGLQLGATGLSSSLKEDLARVEERIDDSLSSGIPYIRRLSDAVLEVRGKMFRPALVILSAGKPGESSSSTLLAGAVVEMIHTATLLHDDVVDCSQKRRGLPTLNHRFGDGPSILMADYIYSRAITLLVEAELTAVLGLLARTVHQMSIGELLQLELKEGGEIDEEAYFRVIYEKTARLIESSCRTGAILSGRSDREVEALGTFGRKIGMAFQIVDDVLDYRSDESTLGKPVGSDLAEGKQTLPFLRALDGAEKSEREKMMELFRNRDTGELLEWVRLSGGVDSSLEEARSLGLEAREALKLLPESPVRLALGAAADYVIERPF
ncbi:MAG: polyprenyl synthetase family protein [Candidatus Krumholzibacteria bacterium]|jgi:octaprenyl-diphosphate synthase|nr:polyprenyl synthetase family protein [Candidatus Krumholzibacteria bacterium]MDP6798008.1 polyprenyl synthetase family protein [Candidatus Krumholzibacteria bacterium]MDP7021263.1 polyprenyl synthetase family protein [Candidatus Krumholzibacteria bacterium]